MCDLNRISPGQFRLSDFDDDDAGVGIVAIAAGLVAVADSSTKIRLDQSKSLPFSILELEKNLPFM